MHYNKKEINKEHVNSLIKIGFHPIIACILDRRQLKDLTDIFRYFCDEPFFEINPFFFRDMENAIAHLKSALLDDYKINIYGDRDVDGITSIAILYKTLTLYSNKIHYQLPVGDQDYSFDMDQAEDWVEQNFQYIITVDCGITNIKEIAYLKSKNIKVLIIDHHTPLADLPQADYIINPFVPDSVYDSPFVDTKIITSAGFLVFQFCLAYLYLEYNYDNKLKKLVNPQNLDLNKSIKNKKLVKAQKIFVNINKNNYLNWLQEQYLCWQEFINNSNKNIINEFLIYAAMSIIADVIPIQGINKIVVQSMLQFLRKHKHKLFVSLFTKLGIRQESLNVKDFSWKICPMINASGRMGDATKSLEVFLETDKLKKENAIKELNELNKKRKALGDDIWSRLEPQINDNLVFYKNNLCFFHVPEISRGITGILAQLVCKKINKPAFITTSIRGGQIISGSCRGDGNHHLTHFLSHFKNIFIKFGGHKNAGGFTFPKEKLDDFKNLLQDKCEQLAEADTADIIDIDAEIPYQYLNQDLCKLIDIFEPSGHKNPAPTFLSQNISISSFAVIGKTKEHLKLFLKGNGCIIEALYWKHGILYNELLKESESHQPLTVDIIYQLELNCFNSKKNLNLIIQDMKIAKK